MCGFKFIKGLILGVNFEWGKSDRRILGNPIQNQGGQLAFAHSGSGSGEGPFVTTFSPTINYLSFEMQHS
jgi:hypothetical protein